MNASASPSIACPRCGAANAAVARFCLGCGSSMQGNAAPPMPPAPPIMQGAAGMLGATGAGASAETTVMMSASQAFVASQQAVRAAGGAEKYAQAPVSLSFEITKKSWWSTSGVTVRYDGVVQVATIAANQSAVRVQLKPQQGTLTPILYIGIITALVLPFLGWGIFGLLLGGAWTGYTWHNLSNAAARELAEKVANGLQVGGSAWHAASAAPAHAAPAPAASATSVSRASVIGQLSELGKLHDAGVLTHDEFNRKKAELLARL